MELKRVRALEKKYEKMPSEQRFDLLCDLIDIVEKYAPECDEYKWVKTSNKL